MILPKNYIIDNLKEAVIVTDADHRFLFLNSMADKIITSINKEQGYSTDDKIYAFIQGSQDFFDWKDRHYQVEETVLKDNELIQGYMMTIVDVTNCSKEVAVVSKELEEIGTSIGVTIHCQREEIFEKMHRL